MIITVLACCSPLKFFIQGSGCEAFLEGKKHCHSIPIHTALRCQHTFEQTTHLVPLGYFNFSLIYMSSSEEQDVSNSEVSEEERKAAPVKRFLRKKANLEKMYLGKKRKKRRNQKVTVKRSREKKKRIQARKSQARRKTTKTAPKRKALLQKENLKKRGVESRSVRLPKILVRSQNLRIQ